MAAVLKPSGRNSDPWHVTNYPGPAVPQGRGGDFVDHILICIANLMMQIGPVLQTLVSRRSSALEGGMHTKWIACNKDSLQRMYLWRNGLKPVPGANRRYVTCGL